MMIMRFHKLIQSRLMWLGFLGIVVISFVFMDFASSSGDASVSRQLRQPVGYVNGEPIRFLEFDLARRNLEQNLDQPLDREAVDELVFSRFARLAKAEKLGLRVPRAVAENDLRQTLARDAANDPEVMERFRMFLRSQNMTESQLVEFIQEEIVLQELQKILASFAMTASFDAERWAAIQTDSFALAVLEITGNGPGELPAADDETLEAYFNEHAADFEISERRRIRRLSLQISDFEQEGDTLSEEQARERFEANPSRFDRQTPVMTEEGGFELQREPREFEEVKDQIIANHLLEQARQRAQDEAMGLSVRLTPRRGRPAPEMADLAGDLGLVVHESGFFERNGSIPGLSGSAALVRAAFELDLTPIGRTSQPVVGRDHVHLLQLTEIEAPRIPAFEEVREEVEAQWVGRELRRRQLDFAASIRETLQAALENGQSISEATQGLEGVELTDPPPFQLMNLNAGMPSIPFALAETLVSHTTGDLIGPVEDIRFGGVYLGYVLSREPREEDAAEMIPQLANELAIHLQFQGITEAFEETRLQPMIRRIHPTDSIPEN